MIYLDNASTSYPKAIGVQQTLCHFYDSPVGSYGRSSDPHTLKRAVQMELLRDKLNQQIGGIAGNNICFCYNATTALNTIIHGITNLKQHEVLVTPLEHNSVTRPLFQLDGSPFSIMPADVTGRVDINMLASKLKDSPHSYRLAIINGMSNVNGVIQPVQAIAQCIRQHHPACLIAVDAAQYLPYAPLECEKWGINFVAIAAHKGYLAPTGIAALYVRNANELTPITRGGSGSSSETQCDSVVLPDRFEAGTINMIGACAWEAALQHLSPPTIPAEKVWECIQELKKYGYTLYSASSPSYQGPLFSIASPRYSAWELADLLWEKAKIMVRAGLHCAPLAHQHLQTLGTGTCRVSLSALTPLSHLNTLCDVLQAIA